MKLVKFLGSICFSLILLASFALCEGYAVKTLDMSKVMKATKIAKEKLVALEIKSKKKEQEFTTQRDSIKALESKLIEKKVSPDSKEADELRTKAKNFERVLKDSQEEMQKEYAKLSREAIKQASDAVEIYAKKHQINLVLEKGTRGASPVLYGDASADITDQVISTLN